MATADWYARTALRFMSKMREWSHTAKKADANLVAVHAACVEQEGWIVLLASLATVLNIPG